MKDIGTKISFDISLHLFRILPKIYKNLAFNHMNFTKRKNVNNKNSLWLIIKIYQVLL